jgi:hypothetical protein
MIIHTTTKLLSGNPFIGKLLPITCKSVIIIFSLECLSSLVSAYITFYGKNIYRVLMCSKLCSELLGYHLSWAHFRKLMSHPAVPQQSASNVTFSAIFHCIKMLNNSKSEVIVFSTPYFTETFFVILIKKL